MIDSQDHVLTRYPCHTEIRNLSLQESFIWLQNYLLNGKEREALPMGSHPLNLALRFILEIAALIAFGYWGWTQHEGVWRYVWAAGLVTAAAAIWGTFAVPDDPSRSGRAAVPIPGLLRLALELAFFAAGAWAFFAAGQPLWGAILGAATIVHYGLSYDRIRWLLGR